MKPSMNSLAGIAGGPFGLSTLSLKRLIVWGEHYKIGQPELDAQHEAIFDIALEAANLWDRRAELQQLKDVTDKLALALAVHFSYEEQLFAGTAYARSEDHIDEHRAMLEALHALRARLETMQPGRVKSGPDLAMLSCVLGLTVGHLSHSDLDAHAAPGRASTPRQAATRP
jgi:hemerythrin